jgi:hypothetical protein
LGKKMEASELQLLSDSEEEITMEGFGLQEERRERESTPVDFGGMTQ